mmetsp:Transcript_89079/g.199163  ORF Transcript_89079/g.199163 Transcript_89079/m.199163 type:complete len:434 (-) Transcript_89079:401-1702(-)
MAPFRSWMALWSFRRRMLAVLQSASVTPASMAVDTAAANLSRASVMAVTDCMSTSWTSSRALLTSASIRCFSSSILTASSSLSYSSGWRPTSLTLASTSFIFSRGAPSSISSMAFLASWRGSSTLSTSSPFAMSSALAPAVRACCNANLSATTSLSLVASSSAASACSLDSAPLRRSSKGLSSSSGMPAFFAWAMASFREAVSPFSSAAARLSQAFSLGSSSASTAFALSTSAAGTRFSSAVAMASRSAWVLRSAIAVSRASWARARCRKNSTLSCAFCIASPSMPAASASAITFSSSTGAAASPSAMMASSFARARSCASSSSLTSGVGGTSSTAMTSGMLSMSALATPDVQSTDCRAGADRLPGPTQRLPPTELRRLLSATLARPLQLARLKLWRCAETDMRGGAASSFSMSSAPASIKWLASSSRPRLVA